MADEARRRVDAADTQQRRESGEGNVLKERNIDEDIQPDGAVQRRTRGRAAEEQEQHQLRRAEKKAQARDGDAAEARRALFAEHAVERKHHGRKNGEHRARGIERRVEGVNDDERRQQL